MGSDVTKAIGLGSPKFNMPKKRESMEDIATVKESAADVRKRRLAPTGRQNALLAGIANALKTRLGQ